MKKIVISYALAVVFLVFGFYAISLNKEEQPPKTIKVLDNKTGNVTEMNAEEFVTGAVSGEMPSDFEEEALKAQAVAARTYLYYKISQGSNHENADICNNPSCCCAFYTEDELRNLKGSEWIKTGYKKIKECVSSTAGEIIIYEGKPILAVFHSAAGGGRTENSGDVWQTSLPYLKSVETAGEEKKNNYQTTVSFTKDEFIKRMKENYPDCSEDSGLIGENTKTQGGAVDSVTLCGIKVKGVQARKIFGLKSACFEVTQNGENIVFTCAGSGHGVGMSQYGAQYMAQNNSTYKDIISKYYTGTVIEKVTP